MLQGTRVNLGIEDESPQRDLDNVGPRYRRRSAFLAIMNCATTISDENAWFWLVSPWANNGCVPRWPLHEICGWSRVQALAYSSDPLLCYCSRPTIAFTPTTWEDSSILFRNAFNRNGRTYCIALFEVRCASKQYRTRRNRVATPASREYHGIVITIFPTCLPDARYS